MGGGSYRFPAGLYVKMLLTLKEPQDAEPSASEVTEEAPPAKEETGERDDGAEMEEDTWKLWFKAHLKAGCLKQGCNVCLWL